MVNTHSSHSQQKKQPRIAIIGAGIAGMNAALTLQDAGLACDIYESSNHVGGRMHSDATTWGDGMVTEWCGEFIDGNHTALRKLAARFGLPLVDIGQVGNPSERIMYFFNRYHSAEELGEAFGAINDVLERQVCDAGFPTTYNHSTAEGRRLDLMSAYDWIERYVEGGHQTLAGQVLEIACRGVFGLETKNQSALNLLYTFGIQFLQQEDAGMNTVQGGTSKIAGGNQQLPRAIAEHLPQGSIHLNVPLLGIETLDDGHIVLSLGTPEHMVRETYDHVILTLPFSTLRHLDYSCAGFDARKQAAIEQLGYGTISKLILQFDTPYWYHTGKWLKANNGFIVTDLNIQTLWDTSRGQYRHVPGVQTTNALLLDYTSGKRGANYAPSMPYSSTQDAEHPENVALIQSYARDCLQQLEQVFPGISSHYTGRAALSYPTGDPNLNGSYSCWRVGQYTQFAGYEGVSQGPIHFAGEHCSIEWQGYMEGAVREGERAAREIIDEG